MGGQKGIAFFYRYLSDLMPVTIISTKNNEAPQGMQADFLPVLPDSRTRYINPFLYFSIKRILKKNNTTHLVLEHPYYGWLGILLKKITGVKLVIHSHNIEANRFKSTGKAWWKILWHYEKWVHQHSDINFFITDEDRAFAIANFYIKPEKCHTITYGFEIARLPSESEKQASKIILHDKHRIPVNEKIFLFNGTLDYKPNQDALDAILQHINPLLLLNKDLEYKIIICGKGLPPQYDELKQYASQNIIYAGFVDDINVYFKGADIFLNPVTDGGGIKTKLVEALGYGLTAVSTRSGAIGIPLSITGNRLHCTEDGDWKRFAAAIAAVQLPGQIPPAFFDHFYWGNIAATVKRIIG